MELREAQGALEFQGFAAKGWEIREHQRMGGSIANGHPFGANAADVISFPEKAPSRMSSSGLNLVCAGRQMGFALVLGAPADVDDHRPQAARLAVTGM